MTRLLFSGPSALLLALLTLSPGAGGQSAQIQTVKSLTGIGYTGGSAQSQFSELESELIAAFIASGGEGALPTGFLSAAGTKAGDETAKTEGGEKPPVDPQFLQFFQQAILDRRPSNILREWSKPEPLAADEDPKLEDPEEPEAPEEAPVAPTEPKAPEKPADLVEPQKSEDVTGDVGSVADLLALVEAKAAAAAAFEEAQAAFDAGMVEHQSKLDTCLLYTSPSPRDQRGPRMPSSA